MFNESNCFIRITGENFAWDKTEFLDGELYISLNEADYQKHKESIKNFIKDYSNQVTALYCKSLNTFIIQNIRESEKAIETLNVYVNLKKNNKNREIEVEEVKSDQDYPPRTLTKEERKKEQDESRICDEAMKVCKCYGGNRERGVIKDDELNEWFAIHRKQIKDLNALMQKDQFMISIPKSASPEQMHQLCQAIETHLEYLGIVDKVSENDQVTVALTSHIRFGRKCVVESFKQKHFKNTSTSTANFNEAQKNEIKETIATSPVFKTFQAPFNKHDKGQDQNQKNQITPMRAMYNKHKLLILGGLAVVCGLFFALFFIALSIFGIGGLATSPVVLALGYFGIKLALSSLGLVGINAGAGFVIGLLIAIFAEAIIFSDDPSYNSALEVTSPSSTVSTASNSMSDNSSPAYQPRCGQSPQPLPNFVSQAHAQKQEPASWNLPNPSSPPVPDASQNFSNQ